MHKHKNGFTLYELLAVLALLAIILTIAKPRVTGYFEKSRETALTANVKLIEDTVRMKLNDYRKDELFQDSGTPSNYINNWSDAQLQEYMDDAFSRYLEIYLENGDWHENADRYLNPYSKKKGIVNYHRYTILSITVRDEQTGENIPINQPAVFITKDSRCRYDAFNVATDDAIEYLKGTIVICINETTGAVDIYFVTKDGEKSDFHVQARY